MHIVNMVLSCRHEEASFVSLKHPVQVPRSDALLWPPRLLILLKVPRRSQIMPPRPKNEKRSIPVTKGIYPR